MEVDSDSGSRRLALIRAVRTLDEDKTVALPEKIQRLWALLSFTKNTRFHGVEENILRWLFKHMSGNTEDAEHVRRYPLTWSILSHVFPKIPLQTLGRSLASLRFVSVLRQAISDITTARRKPPVSPSQTNGVAPEKTRKRKRDDELPSDIEELRTPGGCIKSATELFRALGKLLDQGDQRTGSNAPERRVGAEHIKSLFSSSNEETRDIAAGLILTCDRSLSVLDRGISQDQESWIAIITALWNLRLHNRDDSVEFARHMYVPVCSILTRLRGIAGVAPVRVASDATRNLWIRQLEQFLSAYFIRPARHTFSMDENVEILEIALGVSKRNLGGSAIATWDVAARAPRDLSNPKSKAEHSSWAQNVFGVLLNAIQPLEPSVRNQVIIQLLDTAIQTGSVPSTAVLRTVCSAQALSSNETDWNLVAKIIACDADVFLMDDPLLQSVFGRVSSHSNHDPTAKEAIVTEIILPLEEAFVKARNFAGFIQKWYSCLCQNRTDSLDQSIWFDAKIRQHLAGVLQSAMTPTQLLRLSEHLDSSDASSGALLVVLDGISAGITEEDFINAADSKIFSLIFEDKAYVNLPSPVLSLRWRIAGRMAAWESSDEVYRLWAELQPTLSRILKKTALSDPEAFEAFSCCHKLWLANYPGGRYEADLGKLTCSFLERLASEVKTNSDLSVAQPYLSYVFRYLPKLAELPEREAINLKNLVVDLFWNIRKRFEIGDETQPDKLLQSLLYNFDCEDEEALVDALISHPVNALDNAEGRSGWTEPQSLSLLLILLEFPREALTKGRRKRIMSSWKKWRSAISTRASQDSQFAVTVLRLLVKVMEQPTFYEGMEFDDLVYISSTMPSNNTIILALVERFIDLTLRQVVLNPEGPSLAYLAGASKFVKSLQPKGLEYSVTLMLLVKGLVSALHKSSSSKLYDSAISLDEVTQKLRRMIQSSLSRFASEIKATQTDEDDSLLPTLDIALSGAACLAELGARPLELTEETVCQLQSISTSCMSSKADTGWKLLAFLIRNHPVRYDVAAFLAQLEQASDTVEEDLVYDLVDAFVNSRDNAIRNRLLGQLVDSGELPAGPVGPLLAVKRLVELHRGPSTSSLLNENQDAPDFGAVHERLASLLSQAESLRHFRHLSESLALLLDKHANSMTQFNIETTLSSVVHVCSQMGPKIQHPKAAGEIYDRLYKLVALVLKRHRHRLRGHFPILLAALRALLTTLLADPGSATPKTERPPWLGSRLQSRHAERFARLLTLICEPSAASVARTRSSELDSATDAAKRAAGQDMFTILESYIKLQLEVTVPRDVRKALEPGVYSILDITPQGCRRVLNESLDANGRAIFRQMFADYKKFGKWSGV
ncbi:Urb2/Npa2 family-domain-containing protein [Hypoxylon sp. FL0890]|nr:Urb2/Npa2 family-domain-containing protein [Hypoxylon sp. FL0890]